MKKFKELFTNRLKLFDVGGDEHGITISIMCDCGDYIYFSLDDTEYKKLNKLPYIDKQTCRSCHKSHTLNLSIKSD